MLSIATIAAWLSQFMKTFLFLISGNIRWDAALPLQNFSLKHSRIVAKMDSFFDNAIMTVLDKYTCSSPVVIKPGVAVDVVVEMFNFFIVFIKIFTNPSSYLSKVGTLAYRDFLLLIYREIFEKLNFFDFFSKKN